LKRIADIVQKMKQEHDDYEMQRMIDSDLKRASLKSLIDTEIKKSVRGPKYGILLPLKKTMMKKMLAFSSLEHIGCLLFI
jgi:hypothetical protein